jgi:hypothetical protein
MDNETRASNLTKRAMDAFASQERSNAEAQWQTISKYILPGQSGSYTTSGTNPALGAKVSDGVLDSTAAQSNHDLAAAIHATLTNQATHWAKFRFKEEDLNSNQEAIDWLENATKVLHETFNSSNFGNEIIKAYRNCTGLGNMPIFMEEDIDEDTLEFAGFRFSALHLAETAWSENYKGNVDTIYRRINLTARQAVERFGEKNLPEYILLDLETNPDKFSQFYHVVMPRNKKEVKIVNGIAKPENRPIASIYITVKVPKIVENGGYYDMPIMVGRWENAPNEIYARGPGHMAIPDTRTLNKALELYLKSLEKALDPPMIGEERAMLGNVNARPGGFTVVKDINGIKELTTQARFDVAHFVFKDYQERISKAFFIDKLMLPPRTEHGEMTAYETQQRIEQMHRVLGPTLNRIINDVQKPMVIRGLKILLRAGELGEMPEVLRSRGLDIDIQFVNQLARSQQYEEVSAVQQWIQFLGMAAQLGLTQGLDRVNMDDVAVKSGRTLGVPESSITNDDVVEDIRQQRAEMQQQQMQLESQMKVADIQSKQPTE